MCSCVYNFVYLCLSMWLCILCDYLCVVYYYLCVMVYVCVCLCVIVYVSVLRRRCIRDLALTMQMSVYSDLRPVLNSQIREGTNQETLHPKWNANSDHLNGEEEEDPGPRSSSFRNPSWAGTVARRGHGALPRQEREQDGCYALFSSS